jgi:hypothetical protein
VAGVRGDALPLVARKALGEEVGVEGGPTHHGHDLARGRIHGDDRPLLPGEGRLGRFLDFPVDGQKTRPERVMRLTTCAAARVHLTCSPPFTCG